MARSPDSSPRDREDDSDHADHIDDEEGESSRDEIVEDSDGGAQIPSPPSVLEWRVKRGNAHETYRATTYTNVTPKPKTVAIWGRSLWKVVVEHPTIRDGQKLLVCRRCADSGEVPWGNGTAKDNISNGKIHLKQKHWEVLTDAEKAYLKDSKDSNDSSGTKQQTMTGYQARYNADSLKHIAIAPCIIDSQPFSWIE
ncbi:hypothetical protein HDU96_004865, partial [Phlyctochytrium bullatum]